MQTSSFPQRLALSSAIATALLVGYGGRKSYAGTVSGGPAVFTLSGAANGGTDVTQAINTNDPSNITITTSAGFGIDTSVGGGDGINITTGLATKSATFTDNYNSAVSGGDDGIVALNFGSGALSITATGAVTGTNGDGIDASNYGTDLTLNTVEVSGGYFGIFARNFGSGALSITSTGTVNGTTYSGIYTFNHGVGTDLTLYTAGSAGGSGIAARNLGSGALSITATGAVTGTNGDGIDARNYGTDLTFNTAAVSGGHNGISASNNGSGSLTITATGAVLGTNNGIVVQNSVPGTDLTLHTAAVSGGDDGIFARNFGSGALSITSTGAVTGTNDDGIDARNYGTDLTLNTAAVSGGYNGIKAFNEGSGALAITATGAVSGNYTGINARNNTTSNDLTLNTATVSGGHHGIAARHYGSGALSITATGTITATHYDGIFALVTPGATDVTLNTATVSGGYDGIFALTIGSGALSITATGTVAGISNDGIYALNSVGTDLILNTAAVDGGRDGITARHLGSGALSITATGTVTGTNDHGIYALNTAGTDLTLNTAAVSGGYDGIVAVNLGSGALSITASGPVTGGRGAGIAAFAHGGGDLSVTVSGAVTGGNDHGFYLGAAGTTHLTLNSGASVNAISGVAIYNSAGDATVTVNSGASVTGDIILGDGDDTLIFDGGDFSQVTLFDGDDFANDAGAGGNVDHLTLRGSGTIGPSLLVNWEQIDLEGELAIGNGATLDAGTAFQVIGDLFLNAGGTLDSTGNSPSNTVITGNFSNSGTITMADNETNDSVTVTGDYTSAGGTLELDSLLNDGVVDITDQLIINGNSAGTTLVTVNNVGGAGDDTDTGNPTTDGIQIIQVDGTSAGVFTLANTVSAGAFTYDLVQADGQNWFLQSTGLIDQLFGYSALASAIHDQLEPLRQRDHRGQLVTLDGKASHSGSGFWNRISYSETEADASNSVGGVKVDSELEYERSKVQLGYDQTLKADSNGTLIAGLFGQYQQLDLKTDDAITGVRQADAEAEGWGVGASLTYYAESGWYGDAMVQVSDYDIEVDGASGSEADTDALNWSVSLEGGYQFDLANSLTITPQAQLLWQQTDFDNVTDSNGVTAKWGSDDSLTARFGMTLERDFMIGGSAITGYVVTDVVHAITEAPEVKVNGMKVKSQLNRTRLDLRIGGQHVSADKQLVIYAELGASEGLNSRDYQRIDATAGLRWRY